MRVPFIQFFIVDKDNKRVFDSRLSIATKEDAIKRPGMIVPDWCLCKYVVSEVLGG